MPNDKPDPADSLAKSLTAARGVSISAPRPTIGNIAASLSPEAVKPAQVQLKPVSDEFDFDTAFKCAFVGAGQGGGRMVDAFYKLGYRRACVFNTTDADFDGIDPALARFHCSIGGAAKDSELGRQALERSSEDVFDLLTRSWGVGVDCALVCASLGGGTGSGSVLGLVELARKYLGTNGAATRVGAIVSLPPVTEGFQICRNAVNAFQRLIEANVSPLIVVDNARINTLYKPPMSRLHGTANMIVAQLFHLFNRLAAVHSEFITFDRAELGQLLDSGLVVMGASDIEKLTSPADVSSAVREQLANSVLAQVDIRYGKKAACLLVGHNDLLGKFGLDFFDAGYTALDRVLGSAYPAGTQTVVHRGLYAGTDPGLQAYVMVGELEIPKDRLLELARRGGLVTPGAQSRTAAFLGLA